MTVLTGLNPWTVVVHLLVSLALIAVAVLLLLRSSELPLAAAPAVPPPLRLLARGLLGGLAVVLCSAPWSPAPARTRATPTRRDGLDPLW